MERGARTRENTTELRHKVNALEYPVQLRMYLPLPKEEAANMGLWNLEILNR
jgi:hypothetical protein